MGWLTSETGQRSSSRPSRSLSELFVLHGGPLVDDEDLPSNYNLDAKKKEKNGRVTPLHYLPSLPSCLPRW